MISDPSKIDEVRFWGRIRGTKSNYYIAISTRFLGEYESPSKAFFYATDDFHFRRLPFLIWGLKDWVGAIEGQDFSGEPKRVVKNMASGSETGDEASPEGPEDTERGDAHNGEEEIELGNSKSSKPLKKKTVITELERLAFTVRAIENECGVIPVGSVKIMPNHQLR